MYSDSRDSFRFCDVELRLSGDAGPVVACLQRWYAAFQTGKSADAGHRIEVFLDQRTGATGQTSVHFDDGTLWRLPELRPEELASLLVRRTLCEVGSHFLLHAAALGWLDEGVLLVGASGAGKTTLTLALLQKGFAFLSDETGAVERTGVVIQPFPRLPLRRDRAGALATKREMPSIGKAVALRHLFLLGDDTQSAVQERQFVVQCDRLDTALLNDLKSIAGLQRICSTRCRGLPAFSYTAAASALLFPEIEQFCLARGSTILDVTEKSASPDFTRPPQLRPLARSQAALALLGHLQNGYRSRLLRTVYTGNPTALFACLAGRLRGVSCYRLGVGTVEETVDLLCAAIGVAPTLGQLRVGQVAGGLICYAPR